MFKEGAGRVLRPFLVVLCASYHMVLPIGADEPMGHQIIHEKLIGNLYKVTTLLQNGHVVPGGNSL